MVFVHNTQLIQVNVPMPKFTKKPVTIEAFQITEETLKDNSDWPNWLNEAWQKPNYEVGAVYCVHHADGRDMYIGTLEGSLHVSIGDWIIKGVQGELYPCKPDIFEQTYDPVPDKRVCWLGAAEIIDLSEYDGIHSSDFTNADLINYVLKKLNKYGIEVNSIDKPVSNLRQLLEFIPNAEAYDRGDNTSILVQTCD